MKAFFKGKIDKVIYAAIGLAAVGLVAYLVLGSNLSDY
jgi:hypothetical protein